MTYELAEKLKMAGFPQHIRMGKGFGNGEWKDKNDVSYKKKNSQSPVKIPTDNLVYFPTLKELISACGVSLDTGLNIKNYKVWETNFKNKKLGCTLESALVQLYLKNHK